MKKFTILVLSILSFNISSIFSQGIIAGQVASNMTYYDFPDDTMSINYCCSSGSADNILLDYNQDGIVDIRFDCSGSGNNKGYYGERGSIKFTNQLAYILLKKDYIPPFFNVTVNGGAIDFSMNDSIGNYNDTLVSSNARIWAKSYPYPTSSYNHWGSGVKFIGFYFLSNNQKYFGWIKCELIKPLNSSISTFIVKDIAFETFSVGMEEEKKSDIQIYPNPAKQHLNINGLETSNYPIQIFDITGKVILEEKLKQNRIDLHQLSSGVYFLKIETNDSYEIKKIIKE